MTAHTPLTQQAVDSLLTNTDPWLSCDDCFEGHDAVIEGLLVGHATRRDVPGPFQGVRRVPSRKHAPLATLVAADHGLSPDEALHRLDNALTDPAA